MSKFCSACVLLLTALLLLASCDQLVQKARGGASGSSSPGSSTASGSSASGSSGTAPAAVPDDSVPNCPLAGFSLPPGTGYTMVSENPDNWTVQLAPDVDYSNLLRHFDATLGTQGWHTEGAQNFGNGRLAIYTSGPDSHSIGVQYIAEPDTVPYCVVNITNSSS